MSKNTSINGHEVEYFVDERNRVTGAVIHNCEEDVRMLFSNEYGMNVYYPTINMKMWDRIKLQHSMKAIAICSQEDNFDPEIGKEIAYKRLQIKYWTKHSDRLLLAKTLVRSFVNDLYDKFVAVNKRIEAIDPLEVLTREAPSVDTVDTMVDEADPENPF